MGVFCSSSDLMSSVPANPVYPTNFLSTAPTTLPVPKSCTSFLVIVVFPSVTLMSYFPSMEINFRTFSSPALMFWTYAAVSLPIVISIVFVYRTFPVFRIISSSPSIKNSIPGFSPTVNVLLTCVSE